MPQLIIVALLVIGAVSSVKYVYNLGVRDGKRMAEEEAKEQEG